LVAIGARILKIKVEKKGGVRFDKKTDTLDERLLVFSLSVVVTSATFVSTFLYYLLQYPWLVVWVDFVPIVGHVEFFFLQCPLEPFAMLVVRRIQVSGKDVPVRHTLVSMTSSYSLVTVTMEKIQNQHQHQYKTFPGQGEWCC
jgi:hypothetical protein